MSKTRTPAVEGWFTTDAEAPRLLGTRCTKCQAIFFPKDGKEPTHLPSSKQRPAAEGKAIKSFFINLDRQNIEIPPYAAHFLSVLA